jgi:hypothetical protein
MKTVLRSLLIAERKSLPALEENRKTVASVETVMSKNNSSMI